MAAQVFDKGDVVRLKSGGTKMTVKGYKSMLGLGSIPKESSTEVICIWNDGSDKQRTYHQDLLELA